MTVAELPYHITSLHHSQGGSSYTTAPTHGRGSFVRSDVLQTLATLRDRNAGSDPQEDELVRVLLGDDRLVLLFNHHFDSYALLQRITQLPGYGLINLRAVVPSTGDDVRYNAWLTIAGPAGENYCDFNFAMFNKMLRDIFRELYPAFRNAYSTPDQLFDLIRRRYA